MTSHTPLQTARPSAGITNYQAEEARIRARMRNLEEFIEKHWAHNSVWDIAEHAPDLVGYLISPRQIWGIKQRLDVAKREAEKN